MTSQSQNQLFQEDYEVKKKFERYKSKDPFPEIASALLNSADIYDYVSVTGMIHPFYADNKKLKSASYGVPVLGKLVYWDEEVNKVTKEIKEGEEFTLHKNSIAFVTLEPFFRLPDYIALRFNLQITHVYRGILLGTGPLVDPGFTGQLSIPLHNLTNNDYKFRGGEDLIWIEFTKLSPNKIWNDRMISYTSRKGEYKEFRNSPDATIDDYLRKADPHRPIRSSIPEVFRNAEKAATEASSTVKFFQSVGLISGVAIIIALGALFFQVFSLVREKDDLVNIKSNQIDSLQKEVENMKKEIKNLRLTEKSTQLHQNK